MREEAVMYEMHVMLGEGGMDEMEGKWNWNMVRSMARKTKHALQQPQQQPLPQQLCLISTPHYPPDPSPSSLPYHQTKHE